MTITSRSSGIDQVEVSIVIATFNCGEIIEETVNSVLAQKSVSIEIIIVDDGSDQESRRRLISLADSDHRIHLYHQSLNQGPSVARNLGIKHSTGRWIAIVDDDDILHENRLRRLIDAAENDRADIACDNLEIFDDQRTSNNRLLLTGPIYQDPVWVDLRSFVEGSQMDGVGSSLGFLHPVIRRDLLVSSGVRYDPTLRFGEDYDFLKRLLASGARMRVYPWATYRYRQRPGSLSRQAGPAEVAELVRADARFRQHPAARDAKVATALDDRLQSLTAFADFLSLKACLRKRDIQGALTLLVSRAGLRRRLGQRLSFRLRKLMVGRFVQGALCGTWALQEFH
jgi:glycosyltransferase involved in cell wall biosynthesis